VLLIIFFKKILKNKVIFFMKIFVNLAAVYGMIISFYIVVLLQSIEIDTVN